MENQTNIIKLGEMIAELRRELTFRSSFYPHLVEKRKLKQENAERSIARLNAALETLVELDNQNGNIWGYYQKARKELIDARQILIDAKFETIMCELEHFKNHRSAIAQPLSFHIKQLIEWNQTVQITRDAFRNELARNGYTPEKLRELFNAEFKKQTGGDYEK